VPDSYVPKRGPNKWKSGRAAEVEELLKRFDSDRDYIISVNELHALLSRASPTLTFKECGRIYDDLLEKYDHNKDGELSVEEIALYWVEMEQAGLPASQLVPVPVPVPVATQDPSKMLPLPSPLPLPSLPPATEGASPPTAHPANEDWAAPSAEGLALKIKGLFSPNTSKELEQTPPADRVGTLDRMDTWVEKTELNA